MKVAIIGFGPTYIHAPWDDRSWQIWGLNGGHRLPNGHARPSGEFRADMWFQIHPPEGCNAHELEWMHLLDEGRYDVPTYVRQEDVEHWGSIYKSAAARHLFVPFPADSIRGQFKGGWFANTFCLEMALCVWQGDVSDVALYGIECSCYGREVAVERPAVAYWQGVLAAEGIRLHVPEGCTLAPYAPIYGLDYWDEARVAAAVTERVLPPRAEFDRVNLDTVAAVEEAKSKA